MSDIEDQIAQVDAILLFLLILYYKTPATAGLRGIQKYIGSFKAF